MPAIVNHDERRLEVARAVERLVMKSGMQAVTIRAVGQEAGFSTAVVSHYFHNKEDLLTFTYLSARHRSSARVERAIMAGKDAFACFSECLPLNTDRKMEWKIWFGFWGIINANPIFAEECENGLIEANTLFKRIFKACQKRGEFPDTLDCVFHAKRINFLINGIASVVLQYPELWPARAQEDALRAEIDIIKAYPKNK